MRSTLQDESQFLDVLVEVTRAAWHVEQAHSVVPLGGEGQADLQIQIPGLELPLTTERKRLTGDAREAYGLLVLDLADLSSYSR